LSVASSIGVHLTGMRDVKLHSKSIQLASLQTQFTANSIALQTIHSGKVSFDSVGANTQLNGLTASSTGFHGHTLKMTTFADIGLMQKEELLEFHSKQSTHLVSHSSVNLASKDLMIDVQKARNLDSVNIDSLIINDMRIDGGSISTESPLHPAVMHSESVIVDSPAINFVTPKSSIDMHAHATDIHAETSVMVNGSILQMTGSTIKAAGLAYDGLTLYRSSTSGVFDSIAFTAPSIGVLTKSSLNSIASHTQVDIASHLRVDASNITFGSTGNGSVILNTPNGATHAEHITLQGSQIMTKGTAPLALKSTDLTMISNSTSFRGMNTQLWSTENATLNARSIHFESAWNQATSFETPGASTVVTSGNVDSSKIHSIDLQHGLVFKPENQMMTDAETLTLKSRKLLLAALGELKLTAARVQFVTQHDGSVQVDAKTALEIGSIRIDGTGVHGTSEHASTLIKSTRDINLHGPRLTTIRGQQFRTAIQGVSNVTTGSALIKSKAPHLLGTAVHLGTVDFHDTLIQHTSLSLRSKGNVMFDSDPSSSGTEISVNANEMFATCDQEALIQGSSTILTTGFNGNVTIDKESTLDHVRVIGSSVSSSTFFSSGTTSLNAGQGHSVIADSEYISIDSIENLDFHADTFIIQTTSPKSTLHLNSGNIKLSSATFNTGNMMGSNPFEPLVMSSDSNIISNPEVLNIQTGQLLLSSSTETGFVGNALVISSSWSNDIEFVAGNTAIQHLQTSAITTSAGSSQDLLCLSDASLSMDASLTHLQSSGHIMLESAQDIQIRVQRLSVNSQWNQNIGADAASHFATNALRLGAGAIETTGRLSDLTLLDLRVASDSAVMVDNALTVSINDRFGIEAANIQLNTSWDQDIKLSATGGITRFESIELSGSSLSTIEENFQIVGPGPLHLHAVSSVNLATKRLVLSMDKVTFSDHSPTYVSSAQAEEAVTIGGSITYLNSCYQSCPKVAESKSLQIQSLSNNAAVNITAGKYGSASLSLVTYNSAGQPTVSIQSEKSKYKIELSDPQTFWFGDLNQTVGLEIDTYHKLRILGRAVSAKALKANGLIRASRAMNILSALHKVKALVWSHTQNAELQVTSQTSSASVELNSPVNAHSHNEIQLLRGNSTFALNYESRGVMLTNNQHRLASLQQFGNLLVTGNTIINGVTTKATSFTVRSTGGSSALEISSSILRNSKLKLTSGSQQTASVSLGTKKDVFALKFDPTKESLSLNAENNNRTCTVSEFDLRLKSIIFNSSINVQGSFHSTGSIHSFHSEPIQFQMHGSSASMGVTSGQSHDAFVSVIGGVSQRVELTSGTHTASAVASAQDLSVTLNNTEIWHHNDAGSMSVYSPLMLNPRSALSSVLHVHGTSAHVSVGGLGKATFAVSSPQGKFAQIDLSSGSHDFQVSHTSDHLVFSERANNPEYLSADSQGNFKTSGSLSTAQTALLQSSLQVLGKQIHVQSAGSSVNFEIAARKSASLRITSQEPPILSLKSGNNAAYTFSSSPSEGLKLTSESTKQGMSIGRLASQITGNLSVHSAFDSTGDSSSNLLGASLHLHTNYQDASINVSAIDASLQIGPDSKEILKMKQLPSTTTAMIHASSNLVVGSLERECKDYMGDATMYGNAIRWNMHCYYLSAQPMNISAASDFCEANGGYLATVGQDTENTMASSLLRRAQSISLDKPAFIGYTDVGTYGKFRWMTGETLLNLNGGKYERIAPTANSGYFGHGHNHNSHSDHCVVLGHDETWELTNCNALHLALCELIF